jgi:HEAT repeat protein
MNKPAGSADDSQQQGLVNSLIDELTCDDVLKCQRARHRLVSMGKASVTALINALDSSRKQVRWEAAKTLGQIGDPSVIDALLKTLEQDSDFDVRWVAADGLASIGKAVLVPLLEAIITHSDSSWFRSGAHHVAHNLAGRGFYNELRPVLIALEDPEPAVEVPVAAETALSNLRKRK